MVVKIDKKDMIRLIRGTSPSYEKMDVFERAKLGYYVGGFSDRWEWEPEWSDKWDIYSSKELYDIYRYNLKPDADSFVDMFMQVRIDAEAKDGCNNSNKSISDSNNG